MRKQLLSGLAVAALVASSTTAFAGGAGAPEIEPAVFVEAPAAAAGSLGGTAGLLLGAAVLGAVALAADSDDETVTTPDEED